MKKLMFVLVVAIISIWVAACSPQVTPSSAVTMTPAAQTNLALVKDYLVEKTTTLKSSSAQLATAGQRYYDLAKAVNFDYARLWTSQRDDVSKAITEARTAWIAASPNYEQMEGIVAGVEMLSIFDTNLDAGVSGADGGDNVVTFDLKLPDGRVLPKPGNLFGVTESTLWGTAPAYSTQVPADFNGNGQTDLGDTLPDALILQASTALLDDFAGKLSAAAQQWQPTNVDAFTALVANVPTVGDFFDSWKNSRFVSGVQATERDFVVISRLSDIIDNVTSWQTIYRGISPLVSTVDASQDHTIQTSLNDLKDYVNTIYQQEQGGRRFTPEEADTLSAEAQNRATAIAGSISQVAAKLQINLEEK
ncbi:MAG TPA: imelysin family protein [Anaerolineae bacterium]|nr:imelysin family protein [Anaerolineae bacterium]